jgi:hypothetical protein
MEVVQGGPQHGVAFVLSPVVIIVSLVSLPRYRTLENVKDAYRLLRLQVVVSQLIVVDRVYIHYNAITHFSCVKLRPYF